MLRSIAAVALSLALAVLPVLAEARPHPQVPKTGAEFSLFGASPKSTREISQDKRHGVHRAPRWIRSHRAEYRHVLTQKRAKHSSRRHGWRKARAAAKRAQRLASASIPMPRPRPAALLRSDQGNPVVLAVAGLGKAAIDTPIALVTQIKTAADALADPIKLEIATRYVIETTRIGGTMVQTGAFAIGTELAIQGVPTKERKILVAQAIKSGKAGKIGREIVIRQMNPIYILRAADGTAELRARGHSTAGISSAVRWVVHGVGGFGNKFDSSHTYGLGADWECGKAGSWQSRLCHEVLPKYGMVNPYWTKTMYRAVEHNHYQITGETLVAQATKLRNTVTAYGPKDTDLMWRTADIIIDRPIVTRKRANRHRHHHQQRVRLAAR